MDIAQLSGLLSDALYGGANIALAEKGIDDVKQVGTNAAGSLSGLANQVREGAEFTPYTVRSPLSNATASAEGVNIELSPEEQGVQDLLRNLSTNLFSSAGGDLDANTATLYDQFQSARQPGIDRERLALENRLHSQGRLGVTTDAYGGTPEQLAMAKAIEEGRTSDYFTARNQAFNERNQNLQLGTGLLSSSYAPINQTLQSLQTATPFAELATRVPLQGLVTGAELETDAAGIKLQTEALANDIRQQQLQKLLDAAFAGENSAGEQLINKGLGSLFGGGGLFEGLL